MTGFDSVIEKQNEYFITNQSTIFYILYFSSTSFMWTDQKRYSDTFNENQTWHEYAETLVMISIDTLDLQKTMLIFRSPIE